VEHRYRRVGNGGGWPTTFDDVAAAIDLLADSSLEVDTLRVFADRFIPRRPPTSLRPWAAGGAPDSPPTTPGADPAIAYRVISQARGARSASGRRTRVSGDRGTRPPRRPARRPFPIATR